MVFLCPCGQSSVWREKITKHQREHPSGQRCVKGRVYHVDEELFLRWTAISATPVRQFPETRGMCDTGSAEGSAEEGEESTNEEGLPTPLATRTAADGPATKRSNPPVQLPT